MTEDKKEEVTPSEGEAITETEAPTFVDLGIDLDADDEPVGFVVVNDVPAVMPQLLDPKQLFEESVIEAISWAYNDAYLAISSGKDPRQFKMDEVLARKKADLA